ncbi:hypothetical protein Tsubulata_013310 [Turnera subulata]|uniref:DUF295 domain-containing protein n=1 Tax=Turnera subulata TaxID=218843 RepID=A0A9Q0JIV3_9ROSI|nr:hypothetical protein Tsubulata_013310 [Turnera subulata]
MASLWSRMQRLRSSSSNSCPVVPSFERDHDNKVPPLGDDGVEEYFPLPLTSYPVMMLPCIHNTCSIFNPVTCKFTKSTYPGAKVNYFSSFPAFFNQEWMASLLHPRQSHDPGQSFISLPSFHTIPGLHSLPIDAADPDLKAMAPPGTADCFFYHTNVRDDVEVIKLLPGDLRKELSLGCFALSSAPTDDNCVAVLSPSRFSAILLALTLLSVGSETLVGVVYLSVLIMTRYLELSFMRWSNITLYYPMYLVETPQGDPLLVLRYLVPLKYDDDDDHMMMMIKVVAEDFFLDDTALFVGATSFCVSVGDYPCLMPNSVYFFGRHEIGFCNLRDRTFTHFYQPFEILKEEGTMYPMWVSRPQ